MYSLVETGQVCINADFFESAKAVEFFFPEELDLMINQEEFSLFIFSPAIACIYLQKRVCCLSSFTSLAIRLTFFSLCGYAQK